MIKTKEFRAPTSTPVKVFSDDLVHCAYIVDTWQPLRENLWKAAYAGGCISKDMAVKGFDKEQTLAVIKMEELQYEEQVLNTMKEIIEFGNVDDLDSIGRPKVTSIGDRLGRVPTGQLRNKLFKQLEDD